MASRKRKKATDQLEDWAKWAARLLIAAAFAFLWKTNGTLASIETKIDSHSDQLKAIWQKLGDGR